MVIEAAGGKDTFQLAWEIARPNANVVVAAMYEESQILPLPEMYGKMTANFWYPVMKHGVIAFPRPENCPLHKTIREMKMKTFSKERGNFSGLDEFNQVKVNGTRSEAGISPHLHR